MADPSSRRPRVLLAEDDPISREVAFAALTALGYDVNVVEDGRQAVEAARQARHDAALMDLHMPLMDGCEAATEIRGAESAGRRMPIIAMTAGDVQDDIERRRNAGMDDHIRKPFTKEELDGVLRRNLRLT